MAAAARGYVDSIVEPVDTRKYLNRAFECYIKSLKKDLVKNTEQCK